MFIKQQSHIQKLPRSYIFVFLLLLSILVPIAIGLSLLLVDIHKKYEFWRPVCIAICLFWLIIDVIFIFYGFSALKIMLNTKQLDYSDFADYKVQDNIIVISTKEQNNSLVPILTVMISFFEQNNNINKFDLVEYNYERHERLNIRSANRQRLIIYLEKYRFSDIEQGQVRYRKWNSFEKSVAKEMPEKIARKKERRSTINSMIRMINDPSERSRSIKLAMLDKDKDELGTNSDLVREIMEMNSEEEESSKGEVESIESSKEFSDDKINKIFGLGKYKYMKESDRSHEQMIALQESDQESRDKHEVGKDGMISSRIEFRKNL